ncbi:MAG: efflux transporter periplasmic adaptor subunit, partial [Cytophagales bacterium]|nr:efflux transporter periplasmic adaptor subunit [Cytophaga sp.]
MKTFNHTYLSLGMALLVMACAKPDKKADLEKLKAQQSELNEKITKLEDEIKKEDTTAEANTKYIVVGFEELKKKSFTHYLEVQGKIDSDKNVDISSANGASEDHVYVVKGQQVQKGALLAKTDGEQINKGIQEVD